MQNNLQKLRKERGISQEKLANKANLSRPYLAKIETSKAVPSVEIAFSLAKALDCRIDEIFTQNVHKKLQEKTL